MSVCLPQTLERRQIIKTSFENSFVYCIDKFDIIMGNPPFQKSQKGKRKGGFGGRTLWDKFVKKSLNLFLDFFLSLRKKSELNKYIFLN